MIVNDLNMIKKQYKQAVWYSQPLVLQGLRRFTVFLKKNAKQDVVSKELMPNLDVLPRMQSSLIGLKMP